MCVLNLNKLSLRQVQVTVNCPRQLTDLQTSYIALQCYTHNNVTYAQTWDTVIKVISVQNTHITNSSPVRARFGVSFASLKYDLLTYHEPKILRLTLTLITVVLSCVVQGDHVMAPDSIQFPASHNGTKHISHKLGLLIPWPLCLPGHQQTLWLYRWVSARKTKLQCVSTGVTSFSH